MVTIKSVISATTESDRNQSGSRRRKASTKRATVNKA